MFPYVCFFFRGFEKHRKCLQIVVDVGWFFGKVVACTAARVVASRRARLFSRCASCRAGLAGSQQVRGCSCQVSWRTVSTTLWLQLHPQETLPHFWNADPTLAAAAQWYKDRWNEFLEFQAAQRGLHAGLLPGQVWASGKAKAKAGVKLYPEGRQPPASKSARVGLQHDVMGPGGYLVPGDVGMMEHHKAIEEPGLLAGSSALGPDLPKLRLPLDSHTAGRDNHGAFNWHYWVPLARRVNLDRVLWLMQRHPVEFEDSPKYKVACSHPKHRNSHSGFTEHVP